MSRIIKLPFRVRATRLLAGGLRWGKADGRLAEARRVGSIPMADPSQLEEPLGLELVSHWMTR